MNRILAALFFMVLVAPSHSKEKVEIGKFLDWNGMAKVEIIEPFKLYDFKTIIADPVIVDDIALPSSSNNTFEPVLDAKTKFNTRFFATFREELNGVELRESSVLAAPSTQEKTTGDGEKRLLLKIQLAEIDPGSAAKRMWLGSGRASISITGELINLETGKASVKFQHRVEGRGGPFSGMSYDKLLKDLTEEIAEEIAEFVNSFN